MSIYSRLSTLCTENLTDEQANLRIQGLIREDSKIKTQNTNKLAFFKLCTASHVLTENNKQDILLLLTTYKIDKTTFLILRKYCFENFCEVCVHFYGEPISFCQDTENLFAQETKFLTQSGRATQIKQGIAIQNNRHRSTTQLIGTQAGFNSTQNDSANTSPRLNDSQNRLGPFTQNSSAIDGENITQDDVKEEKRIFLILQKLNKHQNNTKFMDSEERAQSSSQTKSIHVTSNSITTSLYNSILIFYLSPHFTHFTLNFYTFFPILYIIQFFNDQCYPLVSSIIFQRSLGKNFNQLKELVINWYILFEVKKRSEKTTKEFEKTQFNAKRLKKYKTTPFDSEMDQQYSEQFFNKILLNSEIPDTAMSIFDKGIQIQSLHKFHLLDSILKFNLKNCECAMHFDNLNCKITIIRNGSEQISSNDKNYMLIGLWVQYHRFKLQNPNHSPQEFFDSTGFNNIFNNDQRHVNTLKRMPKCSRNCTFYFDLSFLENVDCHIIARLLHNECKDLTQKYIIGIIRSIIHYDKIDFNIAVTLLHWLEKNRKTLVNSISGEKIDFLLKYMRLHPIYHPASLFVPDFTPFVKADNEFEQMVFDNLLVSSKYQNPTFKYSQNVSFYNKFYTDFGSNQSENTQSELLQLLDNPVATLYTLQKHDCSLGVFIFFMGLCVRNHLENSHEKKRVPKKTTNYQNKAEDFESSSGNTSRTVSTKNSLQSTPPDLTVQKADRRIFYTFYLFIEKALIRELQKMESIHPVLCENSLQISEQQYNTENQEYSSISEEYFSIFSHILVQKHPYLHRSSIIAFFHLLKEYFSYIPDDLLVTHFNLSNLLNQNKNSSLGEWTRQIAVWAISRGYIISVSSEDIKNQGSTSNANLSYFNPNPTFLSSENIVKILPFLKQNGSVAITVNEKQHDDTMESNMPPMSSAQEYLKWVVEEIVTSGLTKTSCDEKIKISRSTTNIRSGIQDKNTNQSNTQLPLNMFVIQSVMQFIPISLIRPDFRQLVEIFCTSGFRVNSSSRLIEIINQSDGFKQIGAYEEHTTSMPGFSSSHNVKKFDLVCKKCSLHPHGAKTDKFTLSDSDKSRNDDPNEKFLNVLKEISVLYLSSHLQFAFSAFSHKIQSENLTDCEAYTGWMKTSNREIDCVWYRWFIVKAQKQLKIQDDINEQTFSQRNSHSQIMRFSDDKNTNTTLLFSFMSFFCLKHAKDIFDKIAIIYDLLEHFSLLNFDNGELEGAETTISSNIDTSFIFKWLQFMYILPENFQNLASLKKYLIRELKLSLNAAGDMPHIDVLRMHCFDEMSIAIDIFYRESNSFTSTDPQNTGLNEKASLVKYISDIIGKNGTVKYEYEKSIMNQASRESSVDENFPIDQNAQMPNHDLLEKKVVKSDMSPHFEPELQNALYYNEIFVPTWQNQTHFLFQHILSIYENSKYVCSNNNVKSDFSSSRSIADTLNFFLRNFQYVMGKRKPHDLTLHWILAANIKYVSHEKIDYSEQQGQFSVYSSKCALSFHDSLLLYTLNHDQSFDELRIKNEIVQHMIRNRDARGLFYWGLLNDKFYLNEFIKTKIDQNKPDSEFLYKETVEISKPVPFSIKGTLTPEYYTKLFESDYYQSSVSDLKLQAILLVTNKDNVGQAIKTAEKIVREHEENSNEPYKQNRKKSNQSKVYGKKGTLHQMICQSQDVESNFKSTSLFSKSLVFSTLFLLKARNSDSIETLLFYIRAGYSQILLEECLLRAMELFWEHEVLPNGPHSCSFLTDDTEECKGQHSCVRYVPFYDKYLFYEYDQDSCTYKLFLSETHAFERNDTHKRHSKSSSLSSNTVDDLNALFGAHFLVLLQSHPSWQVAPFFTQFIYKISHKKNKTKTDSPKTTIRTSRQSSLTTVSVYPNSYNTISTEKILFSLLSYMIDCNPWYCAYYGYVYCNKSRDMTEILKTGGDLTSKGTTKNQMYDYSEERFHNKDTITNNKIMKGLKVDASNPTYLFLNHAQIFFTVQAFTQVLLKIGKNGNENITTDEYPELARFKIPIPITSDHCYTQNKDNYVSDISKLKNITNDSIDAAFSNSSFANQTVTLVTISSFSKNISVFKSLQAPKRLIYTDQQGKCRSFMIKCNDELRKDSRMIGMYKLFYKIEEKRDYNRINEMVYRKCKNIWDNVEEKQESVVRPNRESAIRPNRESAIRQNRESAIRSNRESAIRSNRESAIRSNSESAIRSNRESAIRSNRESAIRSNEQISNTVATKIKADNENSEKCLDCASDLTICSHSVDFLNSNKNNCSCQSDNISILDQNVYDSFENGINGSLLRHYVVVPLGDKFGMIEWIGNLATIKSIVWEGNKRTIFNAWKKYKKKIEYKEFLKYEKETQSLLKYWFREKYRNTKEYYKNKYNYLNSLAITSAYGYFLGLGDRHLENINILTDSGTIVHIDLNLLFSKGKQLSVPEKVEFRMSKNIVDNLLIGKENGLFKVRFQEMINLIKKKQSMVEAHLLSFVYDPINELARPKQTITSLIKKLDKNVDELIKENTDKKNLSAMYVGWMPFL